MTASAAATLDSGAPLRSVSANSQRSGVPVLDALLATQREQATKIRSHLAPRNGHSQRRRPLKKRHKQRAELGKLSWACEDLNLGPLPYQGVGS
jgi:hypothetical protein